MANDGYIKLYRKMMKWGWYKDSNTKDVFLHLLFLASYETCYFKGMEIEEGQCVTTVHDISVGTGISVQSVKTALKHLKSTNEITVTSYPKYSIITLLNYNDYQGDNNNSNKQLTNNQQTTNKQDEKKESSKERKEENKDQTNSKEIKKLRNNNIYYKKNYEDDEEEFFGGC